MARAVELSTLGLYNWDNTLFDLMTIPSALDKDVLITNLLAQTAELEVLYPNPVVMKNLLGVWSAKQIDVWNRLYETTQYDYNPIENYNRYETGSTDGTEKTKHGGTDVNTDNTSYTGTDGRTEATTHGGSDTLTYQSAEGGTQGDQTSGQLASGGNDSVIGADTKGHWIAGFDAPTPTAQDDGLFKQTREQDDNTTTTNYGRTESTNGTKTTTFGKTESGSDATAYGKTENVTEQKTYGQAINKTESIKHGEQVDTENTGTHTLHAHGNIGVTTTQKLIREQREIDLFNLYDIIIEDFKMRFCILIY